MRWLANSVSSAGRTATLLGLACAGGWAGLVVFVYTSANAPGAHHAPALMGVVLLAVGVMALIVLAALAARDAARAYAGVERIGDLTETAALAPDCEMIDNARLCAAALRAEVEALDNIVVLAAKRLDAFETGMRLDGGSMARALAHEVATMGAARAELKRETAAIGEVIAHHVAALREATAQSADQNLASARVLATQLEAFGALSSRIGARSAEFAAAASQSNTDADQFDAAVDKALGALARAARVNGQSHRSREALAESAVRADAPVQERAEALAGLVRGRLEDGAPSGLAPLTLSGRGGPQNLAPASLPSSGGAEIITMRRACAREGAKNEARPPVNPSDDSDGRDLAAIVRDSGVAIAEALSTQALDRIAHAGAQGAQARREAVRRCAPQSLRKISAYLRRDARARRVAETLRREPERALGAAHDTPTRRRALASAYLLIDAVLS